MDENQKKNLFNLAAIVVGGIALYKLFSGTKPKTIVKDVIDVPAKVVKTAAKTADKVIKTVTGTKSTGMKYPKGAKKGSPELKAWMAELRSRRKKK